MRFRNLTRRREIGANCYLLESGKNRIVLDAGMHPKEVGYDALPDFGPLPHDTADSILITHAHHDHIGALPVLMRKQPNTPVFMTEPTGEITSAMLHNSVNVMTSQREEQSITGPNTSTETSSNPSSSPMATSPPPFTMLATSWAPQAS
jgi:Cft2 family RNA processing exonuclease